MFCAYTVHKKSVPVSPCMGQLKANFIILWKCAVKPWDWVSISQGAPPGLKLNKLAIVYFIFNNENVVSCGFMARNHSGLDRALYQYMIMFSVTSYSWWCMASSAAPFQALQCTHFAIRALLGARWGKKHFGSLQIHSQADLQTAETFLRLGRKGRKG